MYTKNSENGISDIPRLHAFATPENPGWGGVWAHLPKSVAGNRAYIRAVYTRENKQRIRRSAAYLSRQLSHLYEHGLYKKLVRGLCKPWTYFLCLLYEQFAAYISRGLCNPRLIFPRINRPIVVSYRWSTLFSIIRNEGWGWWQTRQKVRTLGGAFFLTKYFHVGCRTQQFFIHTFISTVSSSNGTPFQVHCPEFL